MPDMPEVPRDEEGEARIRDEIVVDAYSPDEQAIGWYSYLGDKLDFPFTASCVAERAISPLRVGDEVEIVGMALEEECCHEMFVLTPWDHRRTLALPLSQLAAHSHVDEETREAVEDWRYWVARGYEV